MRVLTAILILKFLKNVLQTSCKLFTAVLTSAQFIIHLRKRVHQPAPIATYFLGRCNTSRRGAGGICRVAGYARAQ